MRRMEECDECESWLAIILKLSFCCFRMSFGARGLTAAALGDDMVFAPVIGIPAVKADAFTPDAAIAPPKRTANLPAMPPRNNFLSFCIPIPRFKKCWTTKLYTQTRPHRLLFSSGTPDRLSWQPAGCLKYEIECSMSMLRTAYSILRIRA